MKRACHITLTDEERKVLLRYARGRNTPARLKLRSRIVLLAAKGLMNQEIAVRLGAQKKTVGLWRTRYAKQRLAGIEQDASRPSPNPAISRAVVRKILRKTTMEKPHDAANWSTRKMAKAVGVGHATVQRIWSANGLKPHQGILSSAPDSAK